MNGPYLISIEGIDGAGKSTLARGIVDRLGGILTRQPGGTPLGQAIRGLLANPMHPRTEYLLYAADRVEQFYKIIRPALDDGKLVVCDRWLDSSLAYQGYGRGLNEQWMVSASDPIRYHKPNLTLLLDIDPVVSLARLSSRDRMESESLEFYQRVRDGYLRLAASESRSVNNRWHILHCADYLTPDELLEAALEVIRKRNRPHKGANQTASRG